MVDLINDIEVLQNAIIAFDEGASDEKRSALHALRKMLASKSNEVEQFEAEMCVE